jgi:hypothetical protein
MPYVISWIVTVALLFLLFALASCAGAAEASGARLMLSDVVAAFDQAILQGQNRVSKWPIDHVVRLKVVAQFGDAENSALNDALRMVGRQTRLDLRRVDVSSDAEMTIETVADLGSPGPRIHNVGRTQATFMGASGEMQAATISIARDWGRGDPQRIGRTMPHEMLHAIGFHGHTPDGFDSVMSPVGKGYGPSAWDLLFLKVLYDERLPLGTPRLFALPIACRLLHERVVADRNPLVGDLHPKSEHPHCADLTGRPVATDVAGERVAIAWAYLHGLGVARDLEEAARWTQRSKAAGDRDADYLQYRVDEARRGR